MRNLDKQRDNDVRTWWKINFILGAGQVDKQRDNQTLQATYRDVYLIEMLFFLQVRTTNTWKARPCSCCTE